ncbi:LacI family DNA-binding transcriptional regulator [Modestobacter sp. SSW1-42]|uniref:LacI family DNA-binding transcriptional regulator n=1 Tax=Modestobacter sp. SSW1-42 TaxID=596372 RepID=UPI00398749E5
MAAFTSRDVARLAGVSQSTVSYVMSGRRPISDETRKRVQAAIEQLTYQPNAGARALASQRTQVVGLVVPFGPAADTTGLLPFLETITGCARERDHDVLLVTADEGTSALTRLAGQSLCDAIVLMDIAARDSRLPVAAASRVPVILIGIPEETWGLPCVDLDFPEAARLAVAEIAAAGHDRLVALGYSAGEIARDVNYVGRFERAAVAAAAAAGIEHLAVSPMEPSPAGARAAVEQALALGGPRPALLVPSSSSVPWVLQALTERGVVPGRDVTVVGLCTDAAAETTTPPVTNVSTEPRTVSALAMQTLFRSLERDRQEPTGGVELVTPRLTRRGTTLPPP